MPSSPFGTISVSTAAFSKFLAIPRTAALAGHQLQVAAGHVEAGA
jgi:hypothetical protein